MDNTDLIDKFKRRVKLVKEGKIAPSGAFDTKTFDTIKKEYGGMKSAVDIIRRAYPHGISLEETKLSSTYDQDVRNMEDEMTVIYRFKKRVKLVKEGKITPSGPFDTKTFEALETDYGMNGAIRAIRLGYPHGISLVENKSSVSSTETSKEERRRVYEKQMKNIANEAVRTTDLKNLKGMTNDNVIQTYGKTRGEALVAKRKKGGHEKIYEEENNSWMNEFDDEETEQIKLAAEQERRRKDRESQRKTQEKTSKNMEEEQNRIWREFEKRQDQKKKLERTLTPMKEIEIAKGTDKFAFATTITKCHRVLPLEQKDAPTCWLNSLMMTLFFSQNTRIAIAQSLPYITDKRKFPLVVKIGKLLEGYNKTRASEYIYKRLQPKEFLETLRELYPNQFPPPDRDSKYVKGEPNYYRGDALEYLHRMLQFLEIPHLLLSRPSMKSGKTEWSQYNYDLYESKIFGQGQGVRGEVGGRSGSSTFPAFVDTKHPIILTILTEDEHDKAMTKRVQGKWTPYKTYPVDGFYTDSHAPVIKYNGMKYFLDSMMMSNYNSLACTAAHAIAGVTCNGDRFLYNGWTRNTVDKGMSKKFQGSKEACPLEPTEWAHTANFCISNKGCGYDKFVSKQDMTEMCFSTLRNIRLTYVREDYVGNRIPNIPKGLDRMKQKQTEDGIFNDKRLIDMGILKRDPKTGKMYMNKR